MLFIKTNQQAYRDNKVLYFFEAKPFAVDFSLLGEISDAFLDDKQSYLKVIKNSFVSFENVGSKKDLIALEINQNGRISKVLTPKTGATIQFCFNSWDFEGIKIHEFGFKITVENYRNFILHEAPTIKEYKLFIPKVLLKSIFNKDPFRNKSVLDSPSKMKDFIFNNLQA